MNAVDLLSKDHRTVESLFAGFRSRRDARGTAGIVRKIAHELTIHAELEERFVYPAAKRVKGARSLVEEALREHAKVKKLLAAIERGGTDGESLATRMTELEQNVSHHVEEEESELFPKLESELGEERLSEIGADIRRAKAGGGARRASGRRTGGGKRRVSGRATKRRRKTTSRPRRREKRGAGNASGKRRRSAPRRRAAR